MQQIILEALHGRLIVLAVLCLSARLPPTFLRRFRVGRSKTSNIEQVAGRKQRDHTWDKCGLRLFFIRPKVGEGALGENLLGVVG